MTQRYKIQKFTNITAPDGAEAIHYEVWDVFDVDGEERAHPNRERAFKTEAEAQAWIDKQSS